MKKKCSKVSIHLNKNFYNISLDKQFLKSPENNVFEFNSLTLAKLMKTEIEECKNGYNLNKLLLFNIFSLAVDKIQKDKKKYINEMCKYAFTDLICYRANEPDELVKLQKTLWDPILNILGKMNLKFKIFYGIIPRDQSKASIENLRKELNYLNDIEISCIFKITQISSSILLSYSLYKKIIDEKSFFQCVFLDEIWQSKKWGIIEEEEEKRKNSFLVFKKINILLDQLKNEK